MHGDGLSLCLLGVFYVVGYFLLFTAILVKIAGGRAEGDSGSYWHNTFVPCRMIEQYALMGSAWEKTRL